MVGLDASHSWYCAHGTFLEQLHMLALIMDIFLLRKASSSYASNLFRAYRKCLSGKLPSFYERQSILFLGFADVTR